jgi:hypothetical protein
MAGHGEAGAACGDGPFDEDQHAIHPKAGGWYVSSAQEGADGHKLVRLCKVGPNSADLAAPLTPEGQATTRVVQCYESQVRSHHHADRQ